MLTRLPRISNLQATLGHVLDKCYSQLIDYKHSLQFYWNYYLKCKDDMTTMEFLLHNDITDV